MGKTKLPPITVLVIDDEERDRKAESNVLRANGYFVLEATSYGDAMAAFDLHRHTIQLLLADVSLPDGNGCALAIVVRKQNPDIRVLFVSFHVGSEIFKQYGLVLPDLHFLQKPFAATELLTRVRSVFTSRVRFPRLIVPQTFTSSSGLV